MTKPFIPPDNRSPYEGIGRGGGKIQRPPAQKTEHVQGCGDPSCDICMPRGRPQDSGGAKMGSSGGMDAGNPSAWVRSVLMSAFKDQQTPLFSLELRDPTSTTAFAEADPARDERQRRDKTAAEERSLRGKVQPYLLKTRHDTGWDDVVGNHDARAALAEAIEYPVRHAATYAFYKVRPTRGVLLYGPPGCGKTLFGKAAAGVLARLHGAKPDESVLLHINGPEIQSPYVGVTEESIRTIFAYARAYKALHGVPLTIFVDEADAILPSRDGRNGRRALPWEESQVATFLTEMDGLEESGAFVILATNRPLAIDEAVLRDGRCDRKIKVARPGPEDAQTIVQRALRDVPIAGGADPATLAEAAIAALFDPFRQLARVRFAGGVTDFLRLGDIVNGAMLVGLVEQGKSVAFRRDIAAGGPPGGLTIADLLAAVDSIEAQNRGLAHTDALLELAERFDGEITSVEPVRVRTVAA